MKKAEIREVIHLVQQGWRPYNESPESTIYQRLNCPHAPEKKADGSLKRKAKEPSWFVRGDIFLCIGCDRSCRLNRPEGFILPLPIKYNDRKKDPFTLTPREMVEKKSLLTIAEAAYCLNVGERTVRDWVDTGKLLRTTDTPIRVSAEEVKKKMEDFME